MDVYGFGEVEQGKSELGKGDLFRATKEVGWDEGTEAGSDL